MTAAVTLSGAEAARILNVTGQTLHRWLGDYDFGIPDGDVSTTTGHPRRIPVDAMPRLRVFADLVAFGMMPSAVAALTAVQRGRLLDAFHEIHNDTGIAT